LSPPATSNAEYLPHFQARLGGEKDNAVRKGLAEAIALTQAASGDAKVRVAAVLQLGEMRSVNALSFLQRLENDAKGDVNK